MIQCTVIASDNGPYVTGERELAGYARALQDSHARKIRLLADRLQEAIPRDSFTPIPLFYNAYLLMDEQCNWTQSGYGCLFVRKSPQSLFFFKQGD